MIEKKVFVVLLLLGMMRGELTLGRKGEDFAVVIQSSSDSVITHVRIFDVQSGCSLQKVFTGPRESRICNMVVSLYSSHYTSPYSRGTKVTEILDMPHIGLVRRCCGPSRYNFVLVLVLKAGKPLNDPTVSQARDNAVPLWVGCQTISRLSTFCKGYFAAKAGSWQVMGVIIVLLDAVPCRKFESGWHTSHEWHRLYLLWELEDLTGRRLSPCWLQLKRSWKVCFQNGHIGNIGKISEEGRCICELHFMGKTYPVSYMRANWTNIIEDHTEPGLCSKEKTARVSTWISWRLSFFELAHEGGYEVTHDSFHERSSLKDN
jgi:hypothetical protein